MGSNGAEKQHKGGVSPNPMTDLNDLGRSLPEVVSRQLVATVNATTEEFRADSARPKEWLEKIRPIGFIGKDILAIENKTTQRDRKAEPGV